MKVIRPKRKDIIPGLIVKASQAGRTFPGDDGAWNLAFSAITYDPKMADFCYCPEKIDGKLTYWSWTPVGVGDGELIELCSGVLKVIRNQYVKVKIPRLHGNQEFLVFYNEIKNLTELT